MIEVGALRARMGRPALGRVFALGLVLAAMVAAGLLLASRPAHAAEFTVTNANDTGAGSLRQAILDASAASGADTIKFNIHR